MITFCGQSHVDSTRDHKALLSTETNYFDVLLWVSFFWRFANNNLLLAAVQKRLARRWRTASFETSLVWSAGWRPLIWSAVTLSDRCTVYRFHVSWSVALLKCNLPWIVASGLQLATCGALFWCCCRLHFQSCRGNGSAWPARDSLSLLHLQD